jgi:hypothetical protein
MTTPAHAVINLALFEKKTNTKHFWWIVLGGLVPDLFTTIYAVVLGLMRYSGEQIWEEFYFGTPIFQIVSLTHSLWLFPALTFFFLYVWKKRAMVYLFASWSLHIFADFWLHAEDAYMHFWPLTNWRFESPISYWDPRYYGFQVAMIEAIVYDIALFYLLKKYWKGSNLWAKIGFVMGIMWGILFTLISLVLLIVQPEFET